MAQNKTLQLYEEIKTALIKQGMSYWEAYDTLLSLDAYIFSVISKELVDTLDNKQNLELFEALKENNSKSVSELLGVTKEELVTRHEIKLQEYLNTLSRYLPPETPDLEPPQEV